MYEYFGEKIKKKKGKYEMKEERSNGMMKKKEK